MGGWKTGFYGSHWYSVDGFDALDWLLAATTPESLGAIWFQNCFESVMCVSCPFPPTATNHAVLVVVNFPPMSHFVCLLLSRVVFCLSTVWVSLWSCL